MVVTGEDEGGDGMHGKNVLIYFVFTSLIRTRLTHPEELPYMVAAAVRRPAPRQTAATVQAGFGEMEM